MAFIALIFSVLLSLCFLLCESAIHPVVLVPGDGGSQLEAKLDKESVVHYVCEKKTDDYFVLWLNVKLLVPVAVGCWADNMRLVYNATTRTTENSPGVTIRVPGFGDTATVENVEASQASVGDYFKAIVEESLIPIGYERNRNIRGAPYDFRKAPNELELYFKRLKKLIQSAYLENDNTPVILISHSMGSPLVQHFLHRQPTRWKGKYVRALISLAGAWGGSVKALKVMLSGDALGSFILSLSSKWLREEEKTFPSLAWLLPSRKFWKHDENLVVVDGGRNYTVADYEQLFTDMNYTNGYEMRKDTENILDSLKPPGIETYCIYGVGVSTMESLSYKSPTKFPGKPTIINGNGDGTVNIRSLRGCLRWPSAIDESMSFQGNQLTKIQQRRKMKLEAVYGPARHKIYVHEFPGLGHTTILSDASALNYIQTTVLRINDDRNELS